MVALQLMENGIFFLTAIMCASRRLEECLMVLRMELQKRLDRKTLSLILIKFTVFKSSLVIEIALSIQIHVLFFPVIKTTKNPKCFTIGNTTKLGEYKGGGVISQVFHIFDFGVNVFLIHTSFTFFASVHLIRHALLG